MIDTIPGPDTVWLIAFFFTKDVTGATVGTNGLACLFDRKIDPGV